MPRYLPLFFVFAGSVLGQVGDLSYKNRNVETFEYVWKTVRDKHYDPQLGGVDWQAVHDELKPRIEKADSIDETRNILAEMLGRLHLSHYRIIPGTVYTELGAGGGHGGDGSVGIDVRVIDGKAVVTSVDTDSPAAKAGVMPGWVLRKVDINQIAPLIAEYLEHDKDSSLRDLTLRRAILLRLEGAVGDTVHVAFFDEHDQAVFKNLVRAEPRGRSTVLGYLGRARVWLDSKRVETGGQTIEYIGFNLFLDPSNLMPEFASAVQACLKCAGIVIDLRGNPGGLGAMATGMAGWFVDKKDARLGTLVLRETALKFVINPRAETYSGPLAILVDSTSASTSEIFAGGMQDLKRARIFGSKTAAAALPSVVEMLPNGDTFQYAIANYVSEGGETLEGNGVTPDVETPLTREALLSHKDPALDAAVNWIKSQKGTR